MEVLQNGSERNKTPPSSSSILPFVLSPIFGKEKSLLEEQGLRISENQQNSQKNRRKLAQSTRDFKKASPEEKLSMFNSLLKGYQEEVANITKRAKFGEKAFPNIYQKLNGASKPFPDLAYIAEQDRKLSEVKFENRKMKVELEEFRTKKTHLKNQQVIIRKQEKRIRKLEHQMEEKIKEVVEIKQRNLAEANQITMELLKDREQALQDQLRQVKDSVSTIQKLHELAQSQNFELHQSGSALSLDIVAHLQTANKDTDNKKNDNVDSNSMLEKSLTAKEKRILELNMEIHNVETTLASERENHVAQIKKLKSLLNKKDIIIIKLKNKLREMPSAESIKLEKRVLVLRFINVISDVINNKRKWSSHGR